VLDGKPQPLPAPLYFLAKGTAPVEPYPLSRRGLRHHGGSPFMRLPSSPPYALLGIRRPSFAERLLFSQQPFFYGAYH
jgi:hypothetical protein